MRVSGSHILSLGQSKWKSFFISVIPFWVLYFIAFLYIPTLTLAQTQHGSNKHLGEGVPNNFASYDTAPRPPGFVMSTESPVKLNESQVVNTILPLNSSSPAQFYLEAPFGSPNKPLYIAASLCSGPAIPPYDVDNQTVLNELNMGYWDAMQATVPIMYVSTISDNQTPGPQSLRGDPDISYFLGGLAQDVNYNLNPDGAWITIYPPKDTRNITTGEWSMVVVASTETQPLKLQQTQGIQFADSDRENALLVTYNASQGVSPNLTLAILPTEGPEALPSSYYYNSSICAIATAFYQFNLPNNNNRPQINRSETMRGSLYDNTTRVQWAISNLEPATNYTAWLVEVGQNGNVLSGTSTLWPAVKFVTKRTQNCRLVYDVDFCPAVAYSIPVSPSVSTEKALTIINETFTPNFVNFSATMDTFPCGSKDFGQYSPLQTCDNCLESYRDWLCAVTMPRCTDPLPVIDNQTSAAYPNPEDLMGINTPPNTDLLPYVLNRNDNSRQPYIDSAGGLDAGRYGEVLPCIYVCYEVASSCPQPLIQWYCPIWDITAQSQYGAFADAGPNGLGDGLNGGVGEYGQRFGGPTKYIAQDAFGNVYCNSMGVQRRLLESGQPSKGFISQRTPSIASIVSLMIFMTLIL